MSAVINRQGLNYFPRKKVAKPSRNEPRRTRKLMNGRQARGNKAECRLNRQDTEGKPAFKKGSRPLMSVQHSRVFLSVIAMDHVQRILQNTAEWAHAHAHKVRAHARKVRGRVGRIVHAPACRS